MQKYLFIALGGALGSIARYGVGSWVKPTGNSLSVWHIHRKHHGLRNHRIHHVVSRPKQRYQPSVEISDTGWLHWSVQHVLDLRVGDLVELREGAFGIAALYSIGSFAVGLGATWGGSVLGDLFK